MRLGRLLGLAGDLLERRAQGAGHGSRCQRNTRAALLYVLPSVVRLGLSGAHRGLLRGLVGVCRTGPGSASERLVERAFALGCGEHFQAVALAGLAQFLAPGLDRCDALGVAAAVVLPRRLQDVGVQLPTRQGLGFERGGLFAQLGGYLVDVAGERGLPELGQEVTIEGSV